jgi:hypothetical protein
VVRRAYAHVDAEKAQEIEARFEEDGRAFFEGEWVFVRNYLKYRNINRQTWVGCVRDVTEAPDNLASRWLEEHGDALTEAGFSLDTERNLEILRHRQRAAEHRNAAASEEAAAAAASTPDDDEAGDPQMLIDDVPIDRLRRIEQLCHQAYGNVPSGVDSLLVLAEGDPERLIRAIKATGDKGVRHVNYTKEILRTWAENGEPTDGANATREIDEFFAQQKEGGAG